MKNGLWLATVLASTLCGQVTQSAKIEKMGEVMAKEIRRSYPAAGSEVLTAYVNGIGQRLVSRLPSGAGSYRFEVVEAKSDQPMTLLGGYVFVTTGMLLAAQDESEFAGILAHAIGHGASRHGERVDPPSSGVSFASIPVIFTGGWNGTHPGEPGAVVPQSLQKTMQQWELEADKFGVELAASAGFDPAGLWRFVERTHMKESPALPPREDRLARLKDISEARQGESIVDSSDFIRAQREIRAKQTAVTKPAPSLYR